MIDHRDIDPVQSRVSFDLVSHLWTSRRPPSGDSSTVADGGDARVVALTDPLGEDRRELAGEVEGLEGVVARIEAGLHPR